MSAALEFRNVSHSFGSTEVLHDVSLSIAAGERHALIGPNGAGKSTLFSLACGALRPSARRTITASRNGMADGTSGAGSILLHGSDIAGLAPHEISRRGLARSHQVTSVFPTLSVLDNLRCAGLGAQRSRYAFWLSLEGMRELHARAESVAAAVGLEASLARTAGELPYGAQRALEIGIAVMGRAMGNAAGSTAGNAGVILLDEPTAGMSLEESRATVDIIRRVTAGMTVLLVEHDMDVVFGLADRISVLAGGVVLATGTPDAIRRHPAVRDAYLSPEPEHHGASHA